MKKTTKLAALAVGLAALMGFTFTSCETPYGADDFYGTWQTYDVDENGNVLNVYRNKDTENGTKGDWFRVIWSFNGKSENINDGGYFSQRNINYGNGADAPDLSTATTSKFWYWYGKYDIKANSSYNKGKYLMSYYLGFNVYSALNDGYSNVGGELVQRSKVAANFNGTSLTPAGIAAGQKICDVLDGWKLEDFVKFAFKNEDGLNNLKKVTSTSDRTKNHVQFQVKPKDAEKETVKEGDLICSEVDYYRFHLKSGTFTNGYTRMMITSLAKDGKTTVGTKTNNWTNPVTTEKGNSWTRTDTRYMARMSEKKDADENEVAAKSDRLDNPKWLSSDEQQKVSNDDLFKLAQGKEDEGEDDDENDNGIDYSGWEK